MSLLELPTRPAHDRVLRQLCEALLFEKRVQLGSGVGGRHEWRLDGTRFRARLRRGAFDRIRIEPGTVELAVGGSWRRAAPDDVLAALDLDPTAERRLRTDLNRTAELTELDPPQRSGPRHLLPYGALETAIAEGHPYHPCFKARSGFSDADHRRYGPEGGATFQLHWLMVDPTLVHVALPGPGFWDAELGPAAPVLQAAARGPAFSPLPVHPWQVAALKKDPLFAEWTRAGRLIDLGPHGDPYRATQSVRTLINATDPRRAHVKTAMAMRNTSSLRILEPRSVCVAPAISEWLATVIAADPLLAGLTILREYAGIIAGRDTPLAGHLAAIWRESPEGVGIPAETVMPFNALTLIEPDGRPLVDPWVRRHGLEPWLDRLIEAAVLPVWQLMVAHGIGLEAHAQNLLLRHDDGWPTGLIARDFHESLEYVPWLLGSPELEPDLAAIDPAYAAAEPDVYHAMAKPEALRELVMDTLFVYNLADLSDLLWRHYRLPEAHTWSRVRQHLDRHAAEHGLARREALFLPFTPRILTESLLTQSLHPGRGSYRHDIANALAC